MWFYQATTSTIKKLATLSKTDLYKLIIEMATKWCEIDIIPTKLQKSMLKHCIHTLTKIINLPLNTGKFHEGWKSAVVRPLIKSLQKDTIKTNYRLVHTTLQWVWPTTIISICISDIYSCKTNLVKLINDLIWAMENQ